MARKLLGSVASLWRYPVKSMLGEEVQTSEVSSHGFVGDRAYALMDVVSGKIASAKNPKKWAKLLDFHASYQESSNGNGPFAAVNVMMPSGEAIASDAPNISTVLSTQLGREVRFLSTFVDSPTLEQYWPAVEGTAHQDELTQLSMPPGTFFDSCSIHAITTATLTRLQQLYPEGQFDRCRFRPNLVIASAEEEATFVENDWVGGILVIGDKVRLSIDTACPRCVVTTLAQAGLPADLDILRTAARHNNVIAGIRLSVLQGGTISCNDSVWLED